MGSRARQLQPVGAHLQQALQPVGGDGAPVADMLVDEFSMAGANLLRSGGSSLAAKRKHARSSFDKQMEKDVARLAKMAKWSKRREDAPAPTAITARRRHGMPAKIPPLGKSESFYKDWFLQRSNGTVTAQQ